MTADTITAWLTSMTHEPLLVALALAVVTFATEDGALIAGSLLVGGNMMPPTLTIAALVLGIVIGDIGLYGAGAWLRESRFVRRRLSPRRMRRLKRWLAGRENLVLFTSRFLPGTRLPTYLGFGYLRLSLIRFTLVLLVAGTVWVSVMVLAVSQTQQLLAEVNSLAGLAGGLAVALVALMAAPAVIRRLSNAPDLSEGAPVPPRVEDNAHG